MKPPGEPPFRGAEILNPIAYPHHIAHGQAHRLCSPELLGNMLLKLVEHLERGVGDVVCFFCSSLCVLLGEVGEGVSTGQIPIRCEGPLSLGAIDSVQVLGVDANRLHISLQYPPDRPPGLPPPDTLPDRTHTARARPGSHCTSHRAPYGAGRRCRPHRGPSPASLHSPAAASRAGCRSRS